MGEDSGMRVLHSGRIEPEPLENWSLELWPGAPENPPKLRGTTGTGRSRSKVVTLVKSYRHVLNGIEILTMKNQVYLLKGEGGKIRRAIETMDLSANARENKGRR